MGVVVSKEMGDLQLANRVNLFLLRSLRKVVCHCFFHRCSELQDFSEMKYPAGIKKNSVGGEERLIPTLFIASSL